MTTLSPYLGFRSDAREAFELYRSVLGGELTATTFGEFGIGGGDPAVAAGIMHAQLVTPDGLVLQGADTPPEMEFEEGGRVTVSLFGGPGDAELLRGRFAGLAEGGTVQEPLTRAPWGDEFGMLVDRFGIRWMVNIGSSAGADQD